MKLSSPLTPPDTSCWTLGYSNKWQAGNTPVLKVLTAGVRGGEAELKEKPKKCFKTNRDDCSGDISRRYNRGTCRGNGLCKGPEAGGPRGELKVHSTPGAKDARATKLEKWAQKCEPI